MTPKPDASVVVAGVGSFPSSFLAGLGFEPSVIAAKNSLCSPVVVVVAQRGV